MLALSSLQDSRGNYREEHVQKHARFLACLLNPGDERATYELRFVASQQEDGRRDLIEVALLVGAEGLDAAASRAFAQDRLRLLQAIFDEYRFDLVEGDDLEHLLRPFRPQACAAVGRRSGFEDLETLRAAPRPAGPIGFTAKAHEPVATKPRERASVFHIFPFVPKWSGFDDLFRLMLSQDCDLAICVRLRPTRLREEEEAFLESQIELCERYLQVPPRDVLGDVEAVHATLRRQANELQGHLIRRLRGLKDDAGVLTISVVADAELPAAVVEALGSLISAPVGSVGPGDLTAYYAGGYSIEHLRPEGAFDFSAAPSALSDAGGGSDARRLPYLYDSLAASAVFRLPPAPRDEVVGIDTQRWREKPPPRELPDAGVMLGMSTSPSREVRIASSDRLRHAYVVGQTGTGKTTLLRTMILDDVDAGHGVCVIDPHGDLFHDLVDSIPEDRVDDVVLIDPTDSDWPVGLNLLEWRSEGERHFIAQEFTGILNRLLHDEFGASVSTMAGPVFFQHVRMNTLLAMSDPDNPGTLIDLYAIFEEPDFWRRWVPLKMRDVQLQRWVDNALPNADYVRSKPGETSLGSWIASKFTPFVFDPMLRNIFGQKRSTIDLRQAMDTGKIVLVNLAKGQLTEANSRFFGMVMLAKLQAAAMSRATLPTSERRSFFLYVDEFQSVATENFVTLLSEGRKFGIGLILSNQFVSQLENMRIAEAIFGNVGTMVAFRVGARDAEIVEREMAPALERADVLNLPNWTAYVSTLVDGQVAPPFSLRTIQPEPPHGNSETVRTRSRKRYSRPLGDVETELDGRPSNASVLSEAEMDLFLASQQPVVKAPEPVRVDVVLTGVGDSKIQVIRVLRDLVGLDLKDAKELVERAPSAIRAQAGLRDARAIKAELEAVGAAVELIASD